MLSIWIGYDHGSFIQNRFDILSAWLCFLDGKLVGNYSIHIYPMGYVMLLFHAAFRNCFETMLAHTSHARRPLVAVKRYCWEGVWIKPPWNLTCHWKLSFFIRSYIFKWLEFSSVMLVVWSFETSLPWIVYVQLPHQKHEHFHTSLWLEWIFIGTVYWYILPQQNY